MTRINDKYRPIVGLAANAAAVVGIPFSAFPGSDLPIVTGIWAGMTSLIATESGHAVDRAFAMKVASAVASGGAAYALGHKLFAAALHVVPGPGTLAAAGINSTLNYWFTFRVGKALSTLFDRPDFSSLDLGEMVLVIVSTLSALPMPSEIRDALDIARDGAAVSPELRALFESQRHTA